MTESVTRLRAPTTTDRYGGTIRDWDNAVEKALDGWSVAPRHEAEDHDNGRQGVLVGYTLYGPAGTDVLPSDRLVIRGATHEVDGETGVWTSPWTNVTAGVEIHAKRVDG